jgi:two-component system, OmpR family, sensor histidine kinase BaeS
MKIKLFPKLFLAFLVTSAVLVLIMGFLVNWTFKQGLQDYLHNKELERLNELVPVLENLYLSYGGWAIFRQKPVLFRQAMNASLKHAPLPSPDQPLLSRNDARPFHPPPHPPPRFASILAYLKVFDKDYQLVVGRDTALIENNLHPLKQDGKIIGWLGLSHHRVIDDALAQAFQAQQVQHYYLIALLALFISVLAAWLLLKQLLTPVRDITSGARALSDGDYQTRVKIESEDELGQLAADFNHLAHILERNEQARRQWIADISHELRTPLAVLRGEIEAMQDGVRDLNALNLKSLHGETLRLAQLVDDLYELSLSDLGALNYSREPVDLSELIRDSLQAFTPRFTAKSIQISHQLSEGLILLADSRRLTQLFSNLLENSLRYTQPDGCLEIKLQRQENEIELAFEDSAPGVPEAALGHLFERLYRVDQSRSRVFGGAGLGLSICRNIVNAHEGEISAKPSKLGGLCICIRLPLTQRIST